MSVQDTVDQAEAASAPRNRQQERSAESTTRLLNAAGELIIEGDYTTMTLAAIGERAGFSRGLASARFGSKDKLVEALVERIVRRWGHRNVFSQAANKRGIDVLLTLLDAITAQAARDATGMKVLYALMFQALGPNPTLRERFIEFNRAMRSDLVALLEEGIADGSVRPDISPEDEATFVLVALRGVAYQWALDPAFDPVPAFAHLAKVTRERLSAPTKGGQARSRARSSKPRPR